MEAWFAAAVVIVLAAIVVDRTRAYRFIPAALSRLRRRSRSESRAISPRGTPATVIFAGLLAERLDNPNECARTKGKDLP